MDAPNRMIIGLSSVDSEAEGLASYRVGNAYESIGESKTAIDVSHMTGINYRNITINYKVDVNS